MILLPLAKGAGGIPPSAFEVAQLIGGVPPQVNFKPWLAKVTFRPHLYALAKLAPGLARQALCKARDRKDKPCD